MDLYEVKTRGLHSPLNSREISALFRAGNLFGQSSCKPVGEARWRTIDELFPLLKFESGRLYQMDGEAERSRVSIPKMLTGAFIMLLLAGAAIFLRSNPIPQETAQNDAIFEARARLPAVARVTSAPPRNDNGVTVKDDVNGLAVR